MHTSAVLAAADFRFRGPDGADLAFDDFFPGYHIQDRLAVVVCRRAERAVARAGPALLATTTAFYDVLRSRGQAFFDYPLHFAFLALGSQGEDVHGAPWSNLDVWPETQWVPAPATATGMLREVYRHQIHRLLWPADLKWSRGDDGCLPDHARRLLGSRLKSVHTYGSDDRTIELTISDRAAGLVEKSLRQVPGLQGDSDLPRSAGYCRLETDQFLADMAGCFGEKPAA